MALITLFMAMVLFVFAGVELTMGDYNAGITLLVGSIIMMGVLEENE